MAIGNFGGRKVSRRYHSKLNHDLPFFYGIFNRCDSEREAKENWQQRRKKIIYRAETSLEK